MCVCYSMGGGSHRQQQHVTSSAIGSTAEWDINDTAVPRVHAFDGWNEWADRHCRLVYPATSEEAKRHASGWAMRNTNNHNVHILKVSNQQRILFTYNLQPIHKKLFFTLRPRILEPFLSQIHFLNIFF